MHNTFRERLKHGWNAFKNKDPAYDTPYGADLSPINYSYGVSVNNRPDRHHITPGRDKTFLTAVINRIATDCAKARFEHIRVDENGRYVETIDSQLNYLFRYEANIDQSAQAFMIDLVESLLDEGSVAVVPVDTNIDPKLSSGFEVQSMRIGKIVGWAPDRVQVELYNDQTGMKEPVTVLKKTTPIIENPFYSIMNEKNSTMQRLIRKLQLLDLTDEDNNSGKFNMILQLPYTIRTPARKAQAEKRRAELEAMIKDSQYGLAYTDGTEKIIQLNRPIDSNLLAEVESFKAEAYSQLGITPEIMSGTASSDAMQNYYSRTIDTILSACCVEFERKFLTKTARSQRQAIQYFRDPFLLISPAELPDYIDKLTRNEVATPNEMRPSIGLKPTGDPAANELRNRNIIATDTEQGVDTDGDGEPDTFEDPLGGTLS